MRKLSILLKNEFLKQKKTYIVAIIIGSPIIMGMISFLDLFLRYEYLSKIYNLSNDWHTLIMESHFLWVFLLLLSVITTTSLTNNMEYKTHGWTRILSLPVSKNSIYITKWITSSIYGVSMILIHSLLLILIGKLLGFKDKIDSVVLIKYTLYQTLTMLSVISIQCWLSSKSKNLIISLAIGFIGTTCSFMFAQSRIMSFIVPYTHLIFSLPIEKANINTAIGIKGSIIFSIFYLLLGLLHFKRKDILS